MGISRKKKDATGATYRQNSEAGETA